MKFYRIKPAVQIQRAWEKDLIFSISNNGDFHVFLIQYWVNISLVKCTCFLSLISTDTQKSTNRLLFIMPTPHHVQ